MQLTGYLAVSGWWVACFVFGSFAAFTTQATHQPPPQVPFRLEVIVLGSLLGSLRSLRKPPKQRRQALHVKLHLLNKKLWLNNEINYGNRRHKHWETN
jgi:hypothetical protein